ncbi:hypothetical protein D3C72_2360430 [compost metagenome]
MRHDDSVTDAGLFEDMVRAGDALAFPALAFEAANDVGAVVEHQCLLICDGPAFYTVVPNQFE